MRRLLCGESPALPESRANSPARTCAGRPVGGRERIGAERRPWFPGDAGDAATGEHERISHLITHCRRPGLDPDPAGKTQCVLKLLLPAVVGLTLAGCSSTAQREDAAADVAMRLLTAVDAQDGPGACATLAPQTRAELEDSAGEPCAKAVLEEDLPGPGSLTGTDVYGQWAQIRLTDDTVFLAVFPGGWRVVAAGCTPQGDRPYDCALQGS
jgi:outer membrane murein-binding lipoprotein Lpp